MSIKITPSANSRNSTTALLIQLSLPANSPKNTIRATTGTKPPTSTANTSRIPTTSPKTKPAILFCSTGAINMTSQRKWLRKSSLRIRPTS